MNSPNNPAICPLCGGPNDCQLAGTDSYKGPCWCHRVAAPEEVLQRVPPELRNRACVCRNCLETKSPPRSTAATAGLAGGDFYFNPVGLLVFTAEFLSHRGHCCDNGCRHCPYE